MRYLSLAMVGPIAIALAACNPFASSSSSGDQPLPEAKVVSGEATTDPAAAAPAAGGKPAAEAAAPAAVAANSGDSKPSGAPASSNQCNDSNDRHVVVVNDSGETVRELYGSNVNRTSWEEDVLGSRVLGAGERINVNWDDGSCECNFDFKAVYMDSGETVRRGINVCREAEWHVTR